MNSPYEFAPLHTARLTLRLFERHDLDDVHALMSHPETVRYMPFEPRSLEEVAERIAFFGSRNVASLDGDSLDLAIELDGRVIGTIHFVLTSVEPRSAEIGWALSREFVGRGYAREAAAAMIDEAFGALALHRVFAHVDPRNAASIALCLRLGMRQEAHHVEHILMKGEWVDTAIFGLLAREWPRS